MLRSCQVVASINCNVGGPSITVPRLAQALAACKVESMLATLDYAEHGPQTIVDRVSLLSIAADTMTRRLRGWSPGFRHELTKLTRRGLDVIHSHGLWMFPNLYARQAATLGRIPLVISPRGMVEEWSLRRSQLKKSIVWYLFEQNNLTAARLFHATSEAEARSLRALGLCQPIAVIPNGIDLPDLAATPDRANLESKFPELTGKSWLLFLSRLHEKKGVIQLLSAWSEASYRFPDWQLILAGPDLDGYGEVVRQKIDALGIASRVTLTGMLKGEDKLCALGNASLFVLPTHSENFGIAVAEALAHRCPVITTKGAPWQDLQNYRCGWWIDDNVTALRATLTDALQMPIAKLQAMGQRGRQLMEERYSWNHIGEQMHAAYLWCCGYGEKPEYVWMA